MAEFEIIATTVLRLVSGDEEPAARFLDRVRTVGEKAKLKSGERDPEFNERVGVKVLSEAAYNDDEVVSDYLAGVLASSGPDDDAGAAVVATIGRLSSLQLRCHYVVYRELRRLWPEGAPMNLYEQTEARQAGVQLTGADLLAVGGPKLISAVSSVVWALIAEGLLQDIWKWGKDDLAEGGLPLRLQVRPTALGAELFLWGNGSRGVGADRLFRSDTRLRFEVPIPDTPRSSLLNPPVVGGTA